MAKRKLTRQQQWRIRKIQEERVRRQEKKAATVEESLLATAGDEQRGLVIANHGSSLIVETEQKQSFRCQARQNLGAIVCGDRVIWHPTSADEGVITAVLERDSLLSRPLYHNEKKPVAANIDQILIVSAPAPKLQTALIDRYLVITEITKIAPKLIINKIDLLADDELAQLKQQLQVYENIGYDVIYISTKFDKNFAQFEELIHDKTSVLVGQSGVGKSSIIKKILPDLNIQIGELSEQSKLGKHTTSASRLYHLHNGGFLIDSPGVRDFGLWHIDEQDIALGFREFRPFLGRCKFKNCKHDIEPDCAILHAVETGEISAQRFQSYQLIVSNLAERQD
jgi:ribosome biogenesis GTPase